MEPFIIKPVDVQGPTDLGPGKGILTTTFSVTPDGAAADALPILITVSVNPYETDPPTLIDALRAYADRLDDLNDASEDEDFEEFTNILFQDGE